MIESSFNSAVEKLFNEPDINENLQFIFSRWAHLVRKNLKKNARPWQSFILEPQNNIRSYSYLFVLIKTIKMAPIVLVLKKNTENDRETVMHSASDAIIQFNEDPFPTLKKNCWWKMHMQMKILKN